MNVTLEAEKDRQSRKESCLQKVSAEQKEYAKVAVHQGITENNDTIANRQTDNMLEKLLDRNNLNLAYKKVKSNKGAGGVDGMSVDELLPYLKENRMQLVQQIRDARADSELKRKALENAYPDLIDSNLPNWNENSNLMEWLVNL